MNIFVLNSNPEEAALQLWELDRVRARKQVVEMCQMLATITTLDIPKKDGSFYKKPRSIFNHPATIWIRSDLKNITWCIDFLKWLIHYTGCEGCAAAYKTFLKIRPDLICTNIDFTWVSKKTPQPFKNIFDSHRWYIQKKQEGFFKN